MVCLVGCASKDEGDAAPLPKKDAQASLSQTIKNIESSNMPPEQKQAAIDYAKSNAKNAEKMRVSAQSATAGGGK